MPQRQTPPKFFITHSHNDNKFAKRLCDDLRANGLDGFFDVYSLHAGDDIASQIARGLEECDIYIPVLSPVALQSPWCELEVNAAITLSMERGRGGRPRIIPVIAEECRVPVLLHKSLCINFVGRYDDALNELLTKGLGWSPKPPSPPLPVLPAQPPLVPSSPMFLTQLRTWIVAGGGLMGVLVLYLLMAWITGRLDTTATVTPMHVVQTTAKLASPTSTTTPSSTPTATPTRTDTPTSTPTVTPVPATPTPRAGEERVIGGAPMVFVPAGEFLMGSSDAQAFKNDETPQHKVRLDAFWIDKFEVTNAQYRKCVDAGNCAAPTDNKSYTRSAYYGNPQYDNYPVIYVSWDMATTFCEWAGKRLPTEAEWEKAARGTDGRIYPWGNTFDATKVNSDDSIPRPDDTTAVGSYPGGASPYGAMDMAGNVVEWVNDFYDKDYYILSPRVNPQGAASGPYRVLRGGAYNFTQYEIATTYRGFSYVSNATNIIGFRCAQ